MPNLQEKRQGAWPFQLQPRRFEHPPQPSISAAWPQQQLKSVSLIAIQAA